MQLDGSNSARLRSARIRAAHDDEATMLESMRRNGRARDLQRGSRASLATRLRFAVGRARRAEPESAAAPAGILLDSATDLSQS